jgi:glycosyltransferase involved in cell wall biosynthesis
MVFLGSPDLPANLAALRWWQTAIRPALDAAGGRDVVLTVVGEASTARRRELGDDRLRFAGYVDEVGAELGRHRAMVAPVLGGTGIKTKVLDGLAHQLPIVATTAAVTGLGLLPGLDALISDDPAGFAAHVLRLRDDPEAARRLVCWSRDAVESGFLPDQVTERWAVALARAGLLTGETGSRPVPAPREPSATAGIPRPR